MDFADARTKLDSLRRNTRQLRLWALFYLVGIALVISLIFMDSYRRFTRQVNQQLLLGAQAVPGILTSDYHDRATRPDAISREEFLTQVRRLSNLANHNEFHNIYTVTRNNGRLVFTTHSTRSEKPNRPNSDVVFFQPYPNPPPELIQVFDNQTLTFATYTNQRGRFHSVFISAHSPNGTPM